MKRTHFRTLYCTKSRGLILLLISFIGVSCNVDPQKRPSPLVISKSKIDDVKINLSYSSPSVRERKIFGTGEDYLVPYGELWRTGANKATAIHVEKDILIDYLQLDSGTYSIFTIPNQTEWTVIFNKNWEQWGSYDYTQTEDVLRLQVNTSTMGTKQEKMSLDVEDDSLKFKWDDKRWALPLTTLP